MSENEDIKQLLIKMNRDLHRKFKVATTQRGTTMKNVVIEKVEDYVKNNTNNKG